MDLEDRLNHQIELIENDDSYTDEEKANIIRELYAEARQHEMEQEAKEIRDKEFEEMAHWNFNEDE